MIHGTRILIVGAVLFGLAAPAAAYRTAGASLELEEDGNVVWESPPLCRLYAEYLPSPVRVEIENSIRRSLATWQSPSCSATSSAFSGRTAFEAASGDARNTIQLVSTNWTSLGFPDEAAATTDVLYERGVTGRWYIVEADIYINQSDFDFMRSSQGAMSRDLDAVLTHEFGHFWGLDHPCEAGGVGGAPDCGSNPSNLETTMYPVYTGPEQAELAPDDMMGICYLYPQPSCEITGCDEGEDCRLGRCVPLCGEDVCTGDEVCIADVCTILEEPIRCSDTNPCLSGEVCSFGTCVVPSSAFGDPCSGPEQCASGVCGDSYCATNCTPSGACPAGTRCDGNRCVAELRVFGDPCGSPNDCVSGYCIETPPGQPYCTRDCNPAHPCPGAFECVEVDGEDVCREPTEGAATCSANQPGASLLMTFLVLLFHRRRRIT